MLLIVCLDDNDGMMFGSRRQSTDRVLRDHMLDVCEGRTLWMSPYSASQFDEGSPVQADEDYVSKLQEEDACFVEDGEFPKELPSSLLVYRWNRSYPADRYFPFDPLDMGYCPIMSEELKGFSHERITVDHYERV